MFRFLVIVVVIAAAVTNAFVPGRSMVPQRALYSPRMAAQDEGIFAWLSGFLFPLTATKEMDVTKVVPNPPKLNKAPKGSLQAKRNQIDQKAAFEQRYLPPGWFKKQKLFSNLDKRDLDNLENELEEYLQRAQIQKKKAAGSFVAQGVTNAVSPVDKPMNAAKVVKNPIFFKGGPLSKVAKDAKK